MASAHTMATERKNEKEGGEKEACSYSEKQRLEVMGSLSYSAILRQIVRRGLLDQVEAKMLIDTMDRACVGNMNVFLSKLLYKHLKRNVEETKAGEEEKIMGGRTQQDEGEEERTLDNYEEIRDAGCVSLWGDLSARVKSRLLEATKKEGLQILWQQQLGLGEEES